MGLQVTPKRVKVKMKQKQKAMKRLIDVEDPNPVSQTTGWSQTGSG